LGNASPARSRESRGTGYFGPYGADECLPLLAGGDAAAAAGFNGRVRAIVEALSFDNMPDRQSNRPTDQQPTDQQVSSQNRLQ